MITLPICAPLYDFIRVRFGHILDDIFLCLSVLSGFFIHFIRMREFQRCVHITFGYSRNFYIFLVIFFRCFSSSFVDVVIVGTNSLLFFFVFIHFSFVNFIYLLFPLCVDVVVNAAPTNSSCCWSPQRENNNNGNVQQTNEIIAFKRETHTTNDTDAFKGTNERDTKLKWKIFLLFSLSLYSFSSFSFHSMFVRM